jgi:chromate transport protein ChrA
VNPTAKDPLQKKLEARNWIGLGLLLTISVIFTPLNFTLGILLGGLISIANYYWLYLSLRNAFQQLSDRTKMTVMVKYYIRFAVTGIVLYLVITQTPANVIGLLIGLSVVVINIIVTTVIEVSKNNILKTKEVK